MRASLPDNHSRHLLLGQWCQMSLWSLLQWRFLFSWIAGNGGPCLALRLCRLLWFSGLYHTPDWIPTNSAHCSVRNATLHLGQAVILGTLPASCRNISSQQLYRSWWWWALKEENWISSSSLPLTSQNNKLAGSPPKGGQPHPGA